MWLFMICWIHSHAADTTREYCCGNSGLIRSVDSTLLHCRLTFWHTDSMQMSMQLSYSPATELGHSWPLVASWGCTHVLSVLKHLARALMTSYTLDITLLQRLDTPLVEQASQDPMVLGAVPTYHAGASLLQCSPRTLRYWTILVAKCSSLHE